MLLIRIDYISLQENLAHLCDACEGFSFCAGVTEKCLPGIMYESCTTTQVVATCTNKRLPKIIGTPPHVPKQAYTSSERASIPLTWSCKGLDTHGRRHHSTSMPS